jgi:hypothetical protein
MSGKRFVVFVNADTSVIVTDHSIVKGIPKWMRVRSGSGDVVRAYQRAGLAIARCSDDDADGTIVYYERPMQLWEQEREEMRESLQRGQANYDDLGRVYVTDVLSSHHEHRRPPGQEEP